MTRVLAVEESPTELLELERTLESLGYDVEAVSDAEAARAAFALRRPDAVVSDLGMPGISGFDLCRALKADPATRDIPVLLVTSLADPLDIVRALECGADNYVTKPYPPEMLAARIANALESRQRRGGATSPANLPIRFQGADFTIDAEREQLLDLLLSTIEDRQRDSRDAESKRLALESANHELDAFMYNVSHDLRAPLRAIEGFSEVLQEVCAGQLDATGNMYLSRIRAAADRMSRQLDGLLQLSRATRSPLQRATVDLSAVAHHVIEALRLVEPARVVEVVIQDGVTVQGDPGLLRAVLENIVGNAWKFTGKRTDARIELTADTVADETVIRVHDNGAGFNMAYAGRLFAPFVRLHTVTEFPGTGVGLASVQRVVRRHGGRVWAEGEVDKGATFYVALPVAAPAAEGALRGSPSE